MMKVQDCPKSMSQVLDRVVEHTDGDRVPVGEILQGLGTFSYGPPLSP